MRLLMIVHVHGRVERLRESDAGVERPRDRRVERLSETSARHSFALCVLLVIINSTHSGGTNRKHWVGQLVRQRRWYAGHSLTEA